VVKTIKDKAGKVKAVKDKVAKVIKAKLNSRRRRRKSGSQETGSAEHGGSGEYEESGEHEGSGEYEGSGDGVHEAEFLSQEEEEEEECTTDSLKAGSVVTATVFVTEEFGNDIKSCDWVDGVVDLYNHLGETHAEVEKLIKNQQVSYSAADLNMLRACEQKPCNTSIVQTKKLNVNPSESRAEKRLLLGAPNTNAGTLDPKGKPAPYAKLFRAVMKVQPWKPVVQNSMVVVTGAKSLGKGFNVAIPEYHPLLVVHDPPGGMSFSEYTNSKVSINMEVDWIKFEKDVDIGLGGWVLGDPELGSCAGLGFMACMKNLVGRLGLGMYKQFDDDKEGEYEQEVGGNFELSFSYKTSSDPKTAGIMSDMYLIPGLSIKFSETQVIGFDKKECEATSKRELRWSLEKGKDTKDVFTWMSHQQILMEEIPKLEKLLVAENAKKVPVSAKIQKLDSAISGWRACIEQNEGAYEDAKRGELDKPTTWGSNFKGGDNTENPYSGLAPEDLVAKARKLTPGSGKKKKGKNLKQKAISFAGKLLNDPAGTGKAMIKKFLGRRRLLEQAKSNRGFNLNNLKAIYAREFGKKKAKASPPNDLMKAAIGTIKFAGGGGTMKYTVGEGKHWKKTTFGESKSNIDVDTGGENSLKIFGIGLKIKHKFKYWYDEKKKSKPFEVKDDKHTASFTLGDADVGDSFSVDVFIDPVYRTPLFVTTSGSSQCPHETGTVAREKLGIKVVSPVAPTMPNQPRLFTVDLENNGKGAANFELFMDLDTNQDGLVVKLDGSPLTGPVKFNGIKPGTTRTVVEVVRGPVKFQYKPVSIGFRSQCESSIQETAKLRIDYLQRCSVVEFASDLLIDQKFTVNVATNKRKTHPGQLEIVARNPNVDSRTWKEDTRLKEVVAEYRPVGSVQWHTCRDRKGTDLEFKQSVSVYGYSTLRWDAGPVPDGKYELRLHSKCKAAGGESLPGLDEAFSPVLTGTLDRQVPRQFGVSEPSNGLYFPGSEMSVTFDEQIRCTQPYHFDLAVKVEGIHRVFNKRNMLIVCRNNKLATSFSTAVDYSKLIGHKATFSVKQATDLAGNTLVDDAVTSFVFKKINVPAASMIVRNMVLQKDVPSNSFASTEHASAIKHELVSLLDLHDSDRLEITRVNKNDMSAHLTVDFVLKPARKEEQGASATASALVEKLYLEIEKHNDAKQTSLLQAGQYAYLRHAVLDSKEEDGPVFLANIIPCAEDQKAHASSSDSPDKEAFVAANTAPLAAQPSQSAFSTYQNVMLGAIAVLLLVVITMLARHQKKL